MAKPYKELRAKMSPTAQAEAGKKTRKILQEMPPSSGKKRPAPVAQAKPEQQVGKVFRDIDGQCENISRPDESIERNIAILLQKGLSLNDLHTELKNINVPIGFLRLEKLSQANRLNPESILSAYSRQTRERESHIDRATTTGNAKYAKRYDPLNTVRTSTPKKDWRKKYSSPSIYFSNPGSRGNSEIAICDMADEEARGKYETTGNMLFVLEAFFRRVDLLSGCLTEPEIEDAQPGKEEYTLEDGGGLYLVVKPDGSKIWCLDYCHNVEELKHCFGDYPELSLSYARRYYLAFEDLIRKGKFPSSSEEYKHEIETHIDCHYDEEPDVPIPAWMAQALADGFKQYYSRRIMHHKKVTLDDVLGISGKKRQDEIDIFVIDNYKLLEQAYDIQWHCNLNLRSASKHALRLLQILPEARGDNLGYIYTVPSSIDNFCREVNRPNSTYMPYSEWCRRKGHAPHLPARKDMRETFMDIIEACSPELKIEIENDMKDPRKRFIKPEKP